MMKKSSLQRWVALVLLSGLALGAGAAEPVAVLRQLQGKVFVSQGSAMVPGREGMPLQAGYRVVAVAGGQAAVAYPDGCVAALPENSLLAVKGTDQCRLGQAQVRATRGFQTVRIGQVPPSTEEEIADLKRPEGDVSVEQDGARSPARHNEAVRRDDLLATDQKSQVTVTFRGCVVEVGPLENVTVDELRARCQEGVVLASGADPASEIAIVRYPQGEVMVDDVAARNDMGVNPNNRIVTGAGSTVTVVFRACEVTLGEQEEVRVGELITRCAGGLWVDTGAGTAIGTGITAGWVAPVAVAVIGGIIITLDDDDDFEDLSISPE